MQICRTWPCSKLLHRAGIESLQAAANIHSTLAACRQATQKCAAAVVPADCAEHLTVLSQHTSGAAHPANVLHCRTKYARTTKQSMLDTALANSKRGNPGVTPQGGMEAGWRVYTNQFSHLAPKAQHPRTQTDMKSHVSTHTHTAWLCLMIATQPRPMFNTHKRKSTTHTHIQRTQTYAKGTYFKFILKFQCCQCA